MSSKEWKKASDVLNTIREAVARLEEGKITTDQAHLEARLYGSATKVLQLRLEHAKITSRLKKGSAALPDFTIK